MRHKLFFMTVFLLVISGIGTMLLYKLNYLPQPVYAFLYQYVATSSKASYPYLEKFEGHWTVAFEPNVTGTDIVRCSSETGTVKVHNGHVTGTVGELSRYVSVDAKVDTNGVLAGITKRGSDEAGAVHALLANGRGAGDWSDALDCKGSITLTKLEPVVDPVAGKLISFGGSVKLLRSGVKTDPLPGVLLYDGDAIEVAAGSKIFLSLGVEGQPINVQGPTEYRVVYK
jgi:hypothetical protein